MTDFIKIPKHVFCSYKDKFCGHENNVAKKYDLIYATYTCFTNPPVVLVAKTTRKHQSHNNERKYVNKDIYKTILGFLNVLNSANYTKIVNKLSILITPDNIQVIVNEILRICTIQIFYVKLYIKLLRDLLERCCTAERITAFLCIKKYGADYFAKKEWIYKRKTATTVYADFCLLQKFKTHVLAKNILLSQLHREFDDQLVPKNYATELLDDCLKQEDITLILEVFLALTPFIIETNTIPCDVHAKLDAIKSNSKKNQFMIQELRRLYVA